MTYNAAFLGCSCRYKLQSQQQALNKESQA